MRKIGKKIFYVIAIAAAAGLVFVSNESHKETKIDQKGYISVGIMHYLEDFSEKTPLLLLPQGCEKVGYTSQLNPEADYYATDEVPGSEVFQDSNQMETLYVKRDGYFVKYTLTLAICSLFMYKGNLYICDKDYRSNRGLQYVEITEARRPREGMFIETKETLFLVKEGTIPRQELETNDPKMDGAEIMAVPGEKEYLCICTGDIQTYFVKMRII